MNEWISRKRILYFLLIAIKKFFSIILTRQKQKEKIK